MDAFEKQEKLYWQLSQNIFSQTSAPKTEKLVFEALAFY